MSRYDALKNSDVDLSRRQKAVKKITMTSRMRWSMSGEHSGLRDSRGISLAVLMLLSAPLVSAAPTGGAVSSGSGSISTSGSSTTITQTSGKLAINWNSFNIGSGETVNFVQPGSNAIALNRVLGSGASEIYGNLNANGKVFLINPNGILFGRGASVNVGGLVASTLNISDTDFMAGNYRLSGVAGSVVNQGAITVTDGGYIALLGGKVSNQGTLVARLGSVALAAGSDMTLDFAGDGLLGVTVRQGALQALAENKQLIRADGGAILLTAKAADNLIQAVVNNEGVIEAHTVDASSGRIRLMGDMSNGLVHVGGTLDASALAGGDGGFIETSAARVKVDDSARLNTTAVTGRTGTWLVDPTDFRIAANGGDITGSALSANLNTTNVILESSNGSVNGAGNLTVNESVSWSANTTLTLTAWNDVTVQANITATGNNAGLVINPNTGISTGLGTTPGSGTGKFNLGNAAITLSGATPHLSIAGNSYMVINDLATLQAVNATLDNITYKYYALGSNIDATATAGWNGGLGFVPLGSNVTEFRGIFDGLGHTISNLTVNRPGSDFSALIGYDSGGSMVRNIGLINPFIAGKDSVGGLVGRSYGDLLNAYVSGGSVSGNSEVGGLVGRSYSAANHVYSSAAVNGVLNVGGLIGSNSGPVSDAYASGNVGGSEFVGGLLGSDSGVVSNVYASGNVSGNSYIGGLIGYHVAGAQLSNGYAVGSVSAAVRYGGGLIGHNGFNSGITDSFWLLSNTAVGIASNDGTVDSATKGLTRAQATSAGTYAAAGWDITGSSGNSLWRIYEGDTMPLLRSFLKPVTVTAAAPAVRDYNGSAGGSLAYTTSGGATLQGSLQYVSTSRDVGNYSTGANTLSLSGLYSGQNGYDISYGAASLQINPATLTVTANNDSSTAAGTPYQGGNGVTYSGFGVGDNASLLSGMLTYGGSAQGANLTGNYSIRPGGLSAANYRLVFVDGILNITSTGISSPADISPLSGGGNITGTDKSKGMEQSNAAILRLSAHSDVNAQNGELVLRIVNGGIRLPQGLSEAF